MTDSRLGIGVRTAENDRFGPNWTTWQAKIRPLRENLSFYHTADAPIHPLAIIR